MVDPKPTIVTFPVTEFTIATSVLELANVNAPELVDEGAVTPKDEPIDVDADNGRSKAPYNGRALRLDDKLGTPTGAERLVVLPSPNCPYPL